MYFGASDILSNWFRLWVIAMTGELVCAWQRGGRERASAWKQRKHGFHGGNTYRIYTVPFLPYLFQWYLRPRMSRPLIATPGKSPLVALRWNRIFRSLLRIIPRLFPFPWLNWIRVAWFLFA